MWLFVFYLSHGLIHICEIEYQDDIFLLTTDSEVSEEEVKLVQDLIKHIKAEQHTFVPEEKVGTIHDRERSGSVVECLTQDREAVCSSLTGITALCP